MSKRVKAIAVATLMLLSLIIIIIDIVPTVEGPAILEVDDSGGKAYTSIQAAVDDAEPGDTVLVYAGIYYENVVINKTINLTGENRDTTIINGSGSGDVVYVNASWVNITEFTITGSGGNSEDAGIELNNAQNCRVFNNTVSFNGWIGIYIYKSNRNNFSRNNASSNNWVSIYLYSSKGNNITGNIAMNSSYGVYLASSDGNNITENNVFNNGVGIKLGSSDENNINGNNASLNDNSGISLSNSIGNNITNNIANLNLFYGIVLSSSDGNNITDNTAYSNNWWGIWIHWSKGNTIVGNNVSSNKKVGIYLSSSWENTLIGNTMIKDGIYIWSNSLKDWNTHNIDTSNTVNGKPVYYWKNQTGGTIPPGAGQVILSNCTNVKIVNQELTDGGLGIELGFSSNNNITGNTIDSNHWYGIYIAHSNGNNMSSHIVNNSYHGIHLYSSDGNNITGNTVSNNTYGLYIEYSDGNNITGNGDFLNKEYGVYLKESYENNIIDNNVSLNDLGGIYLKNSHRNNMTDNTIDLNSGSGIYIKASSYNTIIRNNISNNSDGIIITSFTIGKNRIFYNNIIDNTNQASEDSSNNYWDNSYPLGGNYWSDYSGVDNFKGPYQDMPGSDGIGDTPYTIAFSGKKDNYPLMEPYIYKPLENFTILKQGWNLISIPLTQEEQGLTKVLEMIDGWYDSVWQYNVTDIYDPWRHNHVSKPSYMNDLDELDHTMGFWIHITQPGDTIFLYNGTKPSVNQSITLYHGWNLVGYPSTINRTRDEALNNLEFGTDIYKIRTYNATTQKWVTLGPSDYLEVGQGYWMHSKVEKVWNVPL